MITYKLRPYTIPIKIDSEIKTITEEKFNTALAEVKAIDVNI